MSTSDGKQSYSEVLMRKQKLLTGPNFIDWYRQLRLVLSTEDKENYLEHPIPAAPVAQPGQQVPPEALAAHAAWVKGQKEVVVLMLLTMDLDIQQNLAHLGAYDMLQELKAMFSKQAEQELLQTVREFHTCKQEEGQSVSSHVLKMKGYIDNLERLGQPVGQNLAVSLILVSMNKDFASFVQNFNMHDMGKTKQMANKTVGNGVGPVHSRNNVNHQNQFVPQAVLLRTGKVNITPARPQPVPTGKPKVPTPVPTGRQNRPIPVPTDRGDSPSVTSGWWQSTARPMPHLIRPTSSYFQTYTPYVPQMYYNHMQYGGVRWATAENSYTETEAEDEGIFDSDCSKSMTGNMERLDDFQGGKVTFGGGEGRITGKGTIRTPTLDFENVYYVKELHQFNLFSISQICDKKNRVKAQDDDNETTTTNGVAERKNRTLIEAARTMLADSKLPTMFWTEAVRTNIPSVSHFKPFGCHVTILNTSDHLGKFDGKADEGYIVGYSASNKAYRVYNVPTKRVEETMNLRYLEEKPNVQGLGHEWYFDLDYLTDSLGYKRDKANQSAGTHEASTNPAGTQDADSDSECDEQVIIIPSYPSHSLQEAEPKDTSSDEGDDSPHDSAEEIFQQELARLKGQVKRATSDAKDAEELQKRASTKTVPPGSIQIPSGGTTISPGDVSRPWKLMNASLVLFLPSLSYDDEFGADLNNLASTMEVSPLEEMQQFKFQNVWVLVDLPKDKYAIGTKWILKNKRDARGIVVRNKARLGEFEMSAMGELTFFLGLQVQQRPDGIFISQNKYVKEILQKFDLENVRTATTPYEAQKPKSKNEPDSPVNVHLYRSMIGSLMYLTASRPDIMFAVSACSRNQVTPTTSNLEAVKKIFKYLKGQPKLGLWYPRESPFVLEAYSDSDYAGANKDRKSTTGGCQFLGRRLISWQCKKQTIVATSSTEAEYVAAANCCGQTRVPTGSFPFFTTVEPLLTADDGGIDDLPIAEIYSGMDNLGYVTEGKLTFYKNKTVPDVFKLSSKTFANMKLNFAGQPMPLLAAMLSQAQEVRRKGPNEPLGGSFHASPQRSTLASSAGHTSGENELKTHKKLFKEVVAKLVKKVKALEVKLKTKKRKVVLSDSDQEEGGEQAMDLDALIALANAAVTVDSTKSPGGASINSSLLVR
ncbi:putative ribonuclease H-like domain-containing protein [Tanacetum coccineum]